MFCFLLIWGIGIQNDSAWKVNSMSYWKGVYSDGKHLISSQFKWDIESWYKCIFVITHTVGIMSQDENIQTWIQDRTTPTSKKISSKIVGPFGAEYAAIGLIGTYLSGCVTRNPKLRKVALLGAESAFINGIIVGILKIVIGRSRPNDEKGAWNYYPFNFSKSIKDGSQSLPSGHTSSAFAIAACIADECQTPWIAVIGYTTATLVGISRIHDNKHWTSDVFLGSMIGIAVGKTVAKLR